MENDKLVYPLSIEDSQDYSGGSWLSYALGYILSSLDTVEGKDETKYGGQYLESFGSNLQLYETTIVTNIHNGLLSCKPLWNKILYL